jgi:hypothetical protein
MIPSRPILNRPADSPITSPEAVRVMGTMACREPSKIPPVNSRFITASDLRSYLKIVDHV